MGEIRPCRDDEHEVVLGIVNAAAEAYRGVIPADRWHEPYMDADELDGELAAGVAFTGYETADGLVGVMGIQRVRDVDLIRHAYVLPASQGRGVGGALLVHLRSLSRRRILVGTWAAADWAVRFYEHHGFALVPPERKAALLQAYWTIPERQIETSVVLASPPIGAEPRTAAESVSREDLCARIESGGVLVDALSPMSYAMSRLPGAINLPPIWVDDRARRRIPDLDAEIVVYCESASCDSSVTVANRLLELGYRNVSHYPGGKRDWVAAGLELEGGGAADLQIAPR